MKELAAVKFVERRSRFFAHLYRIDSEDDMGGIMKEHRRRYKKGRHHCSALRCAKGNTHSDKIHGDKVQGNAGTGVIGERSKTVIEERSKDDGEVGHPGKVLLELLRKHELDAHALVVSRIFGGVKLGAGGVARAFREAGEGAIVHYRGTSVEGASSDGETGTN